MAKRNVCVIGVGMTKFERCERDFTELVGEAVRGALDMAGVQPDVLEQAFAGYVNGMSTMVRNAGIAISRSSQAMPLTCCIMRNPTMTSAGVAAS